MFRSVELRNQLAAVFLKLGFEEEAAFRMMDAIMKAPLLQGVRGFLVLDLVQSLSKPPRATDVARAASSNPVFVRR